MTGELVAFIFDSPNSFNSLRKLLGGLVHKVLNLPKCRFSLVLAGRHSLVDQSNILLHSELTITGQNRSLGLPFTRTTPVRVLNALMGMPDLLSGSLDVLQRFHAHRPVDLSLSPIGVQLDKGMSGLQDIRVDGAAVATTITNGISVIVTYWNLALIIQEPVNHVVMVPDGALAGYGETLWATVLFPGAPCRRALAADLDMAVLDTLIPDSFRAHWAFGHRSHSRCPLCTGVVAAEHFARESDITL